MTGTSRSSVRGKPNGDQGASRQLALQLDLSTVGDDDPSGHGKTEARPAAPNAQYAPHTDSLPVDNCHRRDRHPRCRGRRTDPVYAIITKQSILDAITVMKKEIAESIEKVNKSIFNVIDDKTSEGDKVIIIGVGNTLGVAQ